MRSGAEPQCRHGRRLAADVRSRRHLNRHVRIRNVDIAVAPAAMLGVGRLVTADLASEVAPERVDVDRKLDLPPQDLRAEGGRPLGRCRDDGGRDVLARPAGGMRHLGSRSWHLLRALVALLLVVVILLVILGRIGVVPPFLLLLLLLLQRQSRCRVRAAFRLPPAGAAVAR